MSTDFLLLSGVWLWAGYWMAYPGMGSSVSIPAWARITGALIAIVAWPVLFPIYLLWKERKRRKGELQS